MTEVFQKLLPKFHERCLPKQLLIATSEKNSPCRYSTRYLFQEFLIEILASASDFISCFQLVYQREKHEYIGTSRCFSSILELKNKLSFWGFFEILFLKASKESF